MTSLQRDCRGDSAVIKNFEETYRTAYSHGLESIYALENVDIRSVRRINNNLEKEAVKQATPPNNHLELPSQLEFDFGEGFRPWLKPFLLDEPIHVLDLSQSAEKCLIEHGKVRLSDLVGCDLRSFIFLKGMGQGHIDEIGHKLGAYTHGKDLQKTNLIDFAGWLRALAGTASARKKMFVLMGPYNLSEIFTLKQSEIVEVRRLGSEKRKEWIQDILAELLSTHNFKSVQDNMAAICNALIKPWMTSRLGIATQEELMERFQRVSLQPEFADRTILFFSEVFFKNLFPLAECLFQIGNGVFCNDAATRILYQTVVQIASLYFYKKGITYGLKELESFVSREAALCWLSFPEGFIGKVLQTSPIFRVRKDSAGKLAVQKFLPEVN